MDMRLPPGISHAAAASAEHPPLRLLQRWQPARQREPAAPVQAAATAARSWRHRLLQLFGR